jgi:MFS family permease
MSTLITETPAARPPRPWLPFYYGWVNVAVAAVAMSATLPGRTHGLGLITKPLTEDPTLGVGESLFNTLNFWAILLGAALCMPVGRMIDRFGARGVLVGVSLGLGVVVVFMSRATDTLVLFVTLTLVRGLGQGALSVISIALVGKWFTRRLGMAMGVYTVLLAIGFIATTLGAGAAVRESGWRSGWAGVGYCLVFGMAPLGLLLARSTPESVGLEPDAALPHPEQGPRAALDLPLLQALANPAFWAFTLASALFGMVWSAITLWNEKILAERGFDNKTFLIVIGVLTFAGLPANLFGGWLVGRWPMGRVLLIGMLFFAASLAAFPLLHSTTEVIWYAAALGISGGIITVIFFTVYGQTFGRTHLGVIQAVVQVVSVLASALGPVLLTTCKEGFGSYSPFFFTAAPLAVVLGVAAWLAPMPAPKETLTVGDERITSPSGMTGSRR